MFSIDLLLEYLTQIDNAAFILFFFKRKTYSFYYEDYALEVFKDKKMFSFRYSQVTIK